MNYSWQAAKLRLQSFTDLAPGWDTYDAPAFKELAIKNSLCFLERLEKLNHPPEFFGPTCDSDGEIIFLFRKEKQEWSFYDDGEVIFCDFDDMRQGEAPVHFPDWQVAEISLKNIF